MVCALPWTNSESVTNCFICKLLSPLALKSGPRLLHYILWSCAIPSWTHLWGTWMENKYKKKPQWILYDSIE